MNQPASSIGILLLALVAPCLLVGCDSSRRQGPPGGDDAAGAAGPSTSTLVGRVKIEGSSTVQPISDAIREAFLEIHPHVDVSVGGKGTGNGFKAFYQQEADICDASRPIKPGEYAKCRQAGVGFLELPIAYDGLTIVVNPENDWVESLSVDQLKQIFVGEDAARRWSDIDPDWPDEKINLFAPGTGSGTYDYFHEVMAKPDGRQLRGDMSLNEDDNVLVQGVAGNKYSIGFFGVAYFIENQAVLKAVPVVNPETGQAVPPTTENIATNRYAPLSRPLFIYVNTESLARPEVQTFVQFFLDHVVEFCAAGKVDYVQLPPQAFARTIELFEQQQAGTHFVNAAGESREGSFSELFSEPNLLQL